MSLPFLQCPHTDDSPLEQLPVLEKDSPLPETTEVNDPPLGPEGRENTEETVEGGGQQV